MATEYETKWLAISQQQITAVDGWDWNLTLEKGPHTACTYQTKLHDAEQT